MAFKEVLRLLGVNFIVFALVLLIPLGLAAYYQFITPELHPQPHSTFAFFVTFILSISLGVFCYIVGQGAVGKIYKKEAILIVVIMWFITPALAALPLLLNGTVDTITQAYFEMTSGLSTTGSTVFYPKKYDDKTGQEIPYLMEVKEGSITTRYQFFGTIDPVRDPSTFEIKYEGIEAVGKAILFWRSFIQWIGGLGIIVIFIIIFPSVGLGGKFLFQSEGTSALKEALVPRVAETALQFFIIYSSLTLLQMILLKTTNSQMEWLDVITIPLSTLPGGGFSIRNASIGYYQNTATDIIVTIFMALGSTSFTVYYFAVRGKFYKIYKPELILYIVLLFSACGLGAWFLVGSEKQLLTGNPDDTSLFTIPSAIRYAFFQVVSSQTSTGFSTANYDIWPYSIQAIMVVVMFIGGMSGSTAGGLKTIRSYIFFQIARFRTESLFRSDPIRQFKIPGQEIDSITATMVLSVICVWIAASTLGTFLYILNGVDQQTAFGLVACMVNNTGLSFRMAGPTQSCAFLSDFGLVLSSLLMLLGRLEFFAVLAILVPAFWRSS